MRNTALVVSPRRDLVLPDAAIARVGARILRRLDQRFAGTCFVVLDICVYADRVAVFSLGVPYRLVFPLELPRTLGLPAAVVAKPFGCQVLVDLGAQAGDHA